MGTMYDYFGTLAGGVCIGPNEDLVAIILNGQEVWPKGTPWTLGATCTAGTLYVFDAQTWTCTSTHVATSDNAPGTGLEGWIEYVFTRSSETYDDFSLTASDGTYYGVMRFYWGTNAQTVDNLLQSTGNDGGVTGNKGNGDQHPDYEGLVYVVVRDFLLGEEVQSGPNIEIVTRRKPNQSLLTGAAAGITDGQANLAAVAVELLTDENCLNLPADMIDDTSFQAVADWLQENEQLYGASVLIDSSETVTSLFDKLVQMFDGYIRFNPATKKIEMGVYQHGQIPTGCVTLTADSFTKFPKFNPKSWQQTISRATVRYNSRQLNYQQTSVSADDPRAFFVLGSVREQSLDRPWIARQAQAQAHGRETLRVIGHAQLTGELEVRREIGRNIRAGDYVFVDIDLEPNANTIYQFFRVTQRKIPPTGPITLSVFADNTLAPVPWNGGSTPATTSLPPVPPITSFRYLEVPTVLSGSRGMIICLAQRPSNLVVGATLNFDTDPAGTFPILGVMSNFAALATLAAPVAATDGVLHLNVNTTQVDADYFTQQYSANEAGNDRMLAFLVSTIQPVIAVGGENIGGVGGDSVEGVTDSGGGQVAENSGYQIMEICSVSTQTLISGGQYDLTVLRGRKNTAPTGFAVAGTEVWLIPASLLSFFTHQVFDQIRANRVAGLTPAFAQFRLCPYTFVNSLALSDAATFAFQFPLNSASAPSLNLAAPAAFSLNLTPANLPALVAVSGGWADPDGNLVEISVALRKSTDTADRMISDLVFAPTSKQAFNTNVWIDSPGTYVIKLTARDSTNLITERDIAVTVTTSAAVKCGRAQVFDVAGNEVFVGSKLVWNGWLGWSVISTNVTFVPFGLLTLACSTLNATIYFTTTGIIFNAGELTTSSDLQTYIPGVCQPFHGLIDGGSSPAPANYTLSYYATAPGFADGHTTDQTIPLFY